MGKIVSVVNQKGGVGKTTTSINLACGIAALKKKVLLVDFDSQGNASNGLGCYVRKGIPTVIDAITKGNVKDCIYSIKNNLDIIPAEISLADIELGKIHVDDNLNMLKNILDPLKDDYDFIIVDCAPSLGILSQASLVASDSVLITIQCEYFALEGATQLLKTIRDIQRDFNPSLSIEGVLITMVDSRTNLSQNIIEEVKRHFSTKMFDVCIPRTVRFTEASARGFSIYEYDSRGEGSKAYAQLTLEFMKRNGNSGN